MTEEQNVLIFLGSPRKKGNSTALAEELAKGAVEAGAGVDSLYLNTMNIHPCQGCGYCRLEGDDDCVLNDDMLSIYEKIRQADALVFATPVYWFTVSAQLKAVMDRFYSFGANGYKDLAGKKGAVLLSYGAADAFSSGAVNALRTFQDTFGFLSMRHMGQVHGSAYDKGEILKNKALLQQAFELGSKLVQE